MFHLCCFFLIPLIALVIAGRNRFGARSPVFVFARYAMLTLATVAVTGIAMIPLGRAAMRIAWNGMGGVFLYVEYGAVAAAFACAAACVLGLLLRAAGRKQNVCSAVLDGRESVKMTGRRMLVHLLMLILLFLTLSYSWGLSHFGNVGLEEIVFHLNVPLEGASASLVGDYVVTAARETALAFLLFEALVFFPAKKRCQFRDKNDRMLLQVFPLQMPFARAMACLGVWFLLLLVGANSSFGISNYVISQMKQSELIEKEYVNPRTVEIRFPEKKRNLITVFVESAETSSQDKANGGFFEKNYIPEMTRIAKENVSFSHSDLIEGAAVAPACGWTMSGLTAQTAGLPLKLYVEKAGWENLMDRFSTFMPGATSLGDILKEAGYKNIFMCGSDLTFGGRRSYFTQHGDYEAYDYPRAKEEGRVSGFVGWGLEDEKLYAWARDVLTEVSASDQPFNLTMLTVDTHAPEGFVCGLCGNEYESGFENVLACSSRQLNDFLTWCAQQPFYENTTIAVLGDHASMTVGFYEAESMDAHGGNLRRKVYNAFINSAAVPVKEEYRLFTTLDFFPTTLAAMGVTIEGDRLGLGTNLFSGRDTLPEEYGYDVLFEELQLKSQFYNKEIMYPKQ